MNVKLLIEEWRVKLHPKLHIGLRVFLGLCLFFKGIQFIQDAALLDQIISKTPVSHYMQWLNLLIPWAHLLCGVLIILGLYIRLAVSIQIPVLIGAVFFVNSKNGIIISEQELVLSIITLLLLIYFLIKGAGTFSLDSSLRAAE